MQKRLLLSNLIEVHRQFQNEHPDVKVGRSKFICCVGWDNRYS